MALAKQAVAAASREGRPPLLLDLLIEPSWKEVMASHMNSTSFTKLQSFLDGEWGKGTVVFPPQDSIFRYPCGEGATVARRLSDQSRRGCMSM